tara:strand:+ start:3085 stop:3360 length:276 start_codon:yes stop_codon:yes gene_type:complete
MNINPEIWERDHARPYFESIAQETELLTGAQVKVTLVELQSDKKFSIQLSVTVPQAEDEMTEAQEVVKVFFNQMKAQGYEGNDPDFNFQKE